MGTIQKIEDWADQHHPKWLDLLRIFLGLIFLIKGIAFIGNREEVISLLQQNMQYKFLPFILAHYIIAVYLVGGIMISIGMLTRIAIVFELPAILGGIIYNSFYAELFTLNSQLEFYIIILALSLFFLFYGSGNLSADYYIKKHTDADWF